MGGEEDKPDDFELLFSEEEGTRSNESKLRRRGAIAGS